MVMFFGLNLGANYNGWLRCDGTQYDESEYPLLYFKLGNMYGGAPGTFRVPDLSGRFIRCTNYNSGTNGIGGGTPFQGEDDSFKSHTHTTSSNGQHAHSFTVYTLGVGTDNTQTYPINNFDSQSGVVVNTNVVGQHSHSMTSSGTVAETAPYSTVLNAYIYALE
jgi:microcystin-dependent protein